VALITSFAGVVTGYVASRQKVAASTTVVEHYLKITNVDSDAGQAVRLVVEVNGQAYSYPSRAVWADVSPTMSPEAFPLPSAAELSIHFSAFIRRPNGEIAIGDTQQLQKFKVDSLPADAEVELHRLDPGFNRGGVPDLRIRYSIY
jgi:hypothetical protein